jgi:flagellar basal body-associated protein FliL
MAPISFTLRAGRECALFILLLVAPVTVAPLWSAAENLQASLASGTEASPPFPSSAPVQAVVEEEHPIPRDLERKQKRDLLKANFEQMQRDARELAELAKSLQEDLDKSNRNVLSLRIVDRAEKIEKLAKKIKTTAKGY